MKYYVIVGGYSPVSYTHLDVYKRQQQLGALIRLTTEETGGCNNIQSQKKLTNTLHLIHERLHSVQW